MNIASHRIAVYFARFSIFAVYFWFGFLKLIDTSAANPLIASLLEQTLPFMTFATFIFLFGIFEMIIGILFLIPRLEKIATALFTVHIATTFMPLILLPSVTWQHFMTPTLEGQYIIKNILLISVASFIYLYRKDNEKSA